MEWLAVSAVVLGTIVFTFAVMRLASRSLAKKLQPLVAPLGGELVLGIFGGAYVRLVMGSGEARIGIIVGSQYEPSKLYVRLLRPFGFTMSVVHKGAIAKGLTKLGVLHPVTLGDPAFDDAFYLRSSDPMRAQALLAETSRRDALRELFADGFTTLKIDTKSFWLIKPGYKAPDLELERIQSALGRFEALVS